MTATLTQPLNNPSWNYIFSTRTGNTCDMTVSQNVSGSSRLYVMGNLCLNNNADINQTSLLVKGNLDMDNNSDVGTSASMDSRVETYVGGNCRYHNGAWATPCTATRTAAISFRRRTVPTGSSASTTRCLSSQRRPPIGRTGTPTRSQARRRIARRPTAHAAGPCRPGTTTPLGTTASPPSSS